MEIVYANKKVERTCKDLKYAKRIMEERFAISLMKKIRFIEESEVLHDLVMYKPFNFHSLRGNRSGTFALDVAGRNCVYRIIIEPLDVNGSRYDNPNIDAISKSTKIVLILEVSDHYE